MKCRKETRNLDSNLTQPEFVPNYGSASAKLPVVSVGPGAVELAILKQEQVLFRQKKIEEGKYFWAA